MIQLNYKQFGISLEERNQESLDVNCLRPYIMALKERDLGTLKCEECGAIDEPLEIHHKRYGKDVNYFDLELVCKECHEKFHKK